MDTQSFLLIILTAFFSMAAIIAVISYPSMDKYFNSIKGEGEHITKRMLISDIREAFKAPIVNFDSPVENPDFHEAETIVMKALPHTYRAEEYKEEDIVFETITALGAH